MQTHTTIVCGTDFSESATEAIWAASALAKRLRAELKLVHVVDELGAELTMASSQASVYEPVRRQLQETAHEVAARTGLAVQPVFVAGRAHESLIDAGGRSESCLIVVSSGSAKRHRWLLGSTAERVVERSPFPVLVVKDATSIKRWADREEPLRVMIGVETTAGSRAALRWAADFSEFGQCNLLVEHIASASKEHKRLGFPAPSSRDALLPEVRELLERDIRAWAGDLLSPGQPLSVTSGAARADEQLIARSAAENADLLIVGTDLHSGAPRSRRRSTGQSVVNSAVSNVVCVPGRLERSADHTYGSVLIPTDFSDFANRAIPAGYRLLRPGGQVYLLHIAQVESEQSDFAERLRSLEPSWAALRNIETRSEVILSDNPGQRIWQAASHLGVDVVCMAASSRSRLSKAMLGSSAYEVVRHAGRPVVLVPPEQGHDDDGPTK